jgi:type II secretory pathway component PulF
MSAKKFKVKYYDEKGREIEEIIVASSREEIEELLGYKGYTPIEIKKIFSLGIRKDTRKVVAFFKNLINLLESGFSVNNALEIMADSEKDPAFKKVINDIIAVLNKGFSFSEGLNLHSEWFSSPVRSIVHSGETSGRLLPVLHECVSYLEEEVKITGKIKKDLMPPLFMLFAGIGILFFNTTFLFPKITNSSFFKQFMASNVGLSFKLINLTTKIVPIIFMSLLILGGSLVFIYRNWQEKIEEQLLKIPIVSSIWFSREIYILYYSLSKLLSTGVPFETALDVLRQNSKIKIVRNSLDKSLDKLRQGQNPAEELPILDSIERSLVKGATTLQKLAEVFSIIARRKQESYNETLKKLPSICKGVVFAILIYLVFITFFGILVPYYKSISHSLATLG